MTRHASNDYRKRPIRRDRVAIAVFFVVAIIVMPILLRSGCSRSEDPLTIIDNGTTSVVDGTSDIDSIIEDLISDTSVVEPTSLPVGILTHVVEDGETIASAAAALGVSIDSVRASNQLYGGEALQPGQVLYASHDGVLHWIKEGQTLTDIALSYAIPVEVLTAANNITAAATIFAGDWILIPGVTETFWNQVVVLSKGVPSQFIWPLQGEVVSTFGWREHPVLGERHHHDGIDIDVPENTIVRASASGEVYFYGEQPGYGNVLILRHADGFFTLYGHLANAFVYRGQFVEAGQRVAQSGNTGISSGPHLHFELRNGEFPVDPLRYLP